MPRPARKHLPVSRALVPVAAYPEERADVKALSYPRRADGAGGRSTKDKGPRVATGPFRVEAPGIECR